MEVYRPMNKAPDELTKEEIAEYFAYCNPAYTNKFVVVCTPTTVNIACANEVVDGISLPHSVLVLNHENTRQLIRVLTEVLSNNGGNNATVQ